MDRRGWRKPSARSIIEWGEVPWTLWVFVALTTLAPVVVALTSSIKPALQVYFFLATLMWNFFLLRGVRWLWLATVIVGLLGAVVDLVTGIGTWHGHLLGLIEIALLVLPVTRRFFRSGPSGEMKAVKSG